MLRSITVGLSAFALVAAATAQFDGPAPLAWRWVQPTTVSPGGSPLVDGNTIYQAVGGRIFCLQKDTGNLKWRFPQLDPIGGAFRSTPILLDGNLLATGDNKIVYAIDPATGQSKWSSNLPAGAIANPVAVGHFLVVAMGDNTITALNSADGSPAWASAPIYKVFDGISGSLAVSGRDVLYFTGRSELMALNVAARTPDWHQTFDQLPPNPSATVFGESIYLNSGPFLIALNSATGLARWQIDTQMQLIFSPVCSPTNIFVVSQDGKAIAYDATTRKPLTKEPIDLGTFAMTKPTNVGTKYIVPTTSGGVELVDPTSAEIQWSYLIRPLVETANETSSRGAGRPGGPGGGGAGAPGGGGGPGGGGPGGFGGGQQNKKPEKVASVQASAPAVLAGTTLLVAAKDGSLLAFDKDLGVDLTPPKVEMLFPNPGDQVSGQPPLLLYFRISDDASGLKNDSLKIDINGQPLDYTLNKDGTVVVRFSLTGKNHALSDGRKEIVVTASDWMGNEAKKSFSLTIDNALRPIVLPGQEEKNPGGRGGGFGGGGGGGGRGGGGGG